VKAPLARRRSGPRGALAQAAKNRRKNQPPQGWTGANSRPVALIPTEAEAALRRSEQHFRALVQASSDVVYRMSADWSEMRHLVGRDFISDTIEPSKTWLQKYLHPEDQPGVLAVINEAIHTRSVFDLEHRVLRVDGTLGWTHSRAIPILDEQGGVIEWLGMASDVTRRKEAEEALRYHSNLVQSIADNAATSIFVTDEAGRITFVNPEAERTFGFARNGLVGQMLHERLHHHRPDGRVFPVEDCALARIFNSGETVRNHEDVFFRKDGSQVLVSCSNARLVVDGKCLGTVIVVHDITARKQAESVLSRAREELEQRVSERTAELAQANERLTTQITERARAQRELSRQAAVLNMVTDAVIIWHLDDGIRYWNHGAQTMYGFTAEEALDHQPQVLLKTVFPTSVEAYRSELMQAGTWQGELIHVTKTGQHARVESHHQLLQQPDGTQLVLETNHDITLRTALEEAIVGAGERERKHLGQDLHDGLCQLLTAARLKSDSLVARLVPRAPTELETARTALKLVTQALDEARRLARGLEPVEPVPEGLAVALQNLASTLRETFNVACVCKIPVPVLMPDPKVAAELFRIAQEATNNAHRHSHAKCIAIRLLETADAVTMTVSCDGRPFPARPSNRGTGLKTMRYRARRIGATLEVEPGSKGGAVVRCVLPKPSGRNPPEHLDLISGEHQMVLSALRSSAGNYSNHEPSRPKPS